MCSGQTLIEDNTVISGNQGGNQGGGIFNEGTLTITDSTIGGPEPGDGNSANIGGGIADNYFGSFTVTDCKFEYNYRANSSGGGAGAGGAIWSATSFSVAGGTFSHNSAWYGGAIQVISTATISGSQFDDNSARLRRCDLRAAESLASKAVPCRVTAAFRLRRRSLQQQRIGNDHR